MGCLKSKNGSKNHMTDQEMLIKGNHEEHHLHLNKQEKASTVHVIAGVHQLK